MNILTQKHLQEFAESGISKEIAEVIFHSVSDSRKISTFLGWKGYKGPSGWLYTGINPVTGEDTGIGQFKPDGGITFPDGKDAKYLSQKDTSRNGKYDACCIAVPGIDWQKVVEDVSIPIRCGEGGKKAVCSMIHTSVPTIALSGVDMGVVGKGAHRKLVPTLALLATPERPVEIAYDSDLTEKEEVCCALATLGKLLKKAGCIVSVRTWPMEIGKGIDDAIVAIGTEEFLRQSKVTEFDEWLENWVNKDDRTSNPKAKKPPAQSIFAQTISEAYKEHLAWRPDIEKWYRYSSDIEGIWTKEPEEFVARIVKLELDINGWSYSAGYLAGALKLLKVDLAVKGWDEANNLIPCENGVLDMKTLKLLPHSPETRLTWCLPYKYNPIATCQPILDWLKETTANESQIELLRAYLAATLRGRTDIHGFLELLGPGGSGKGTFMRLATALVGDRNTHITKLKKLEGSPFETASLMNKRLILITDSDKYQGSVETLKALTGGDKLPYEQKFIQSDDGFCAKAKVIIACNEPIQTNDYTSGLQRRRIVVPFDNQVAKNNQRTLLEEVNGELVGEFTEYLPGLLNWVLAMSTESIENYLKRTEEFVIDYSQIQAQAIIATNPIADWADFALIYEEGAKLQIGVAQKNRDNSVNNTYLNVASWAYANYAEYQANTGAGGILSLRRFVTLAKDLFVNQLKKFNIKHTRDRVCSFFENLRIRSQEFDGEKPRLISEQPSNINCQLSTPPEQPPIAPKQLSTVNYQPHTPEPDWATFPSANSDSTETRKNKATCCKNQLLKAIKNAKCRKDIAPLRKRWTSEEVNWTAKYLLSKEEARKLKAILATDQMELL
jgi:putative DNA primase/helicase